VVRALFLARKLRPGSVASDFPTQLTRETEQLLKEAVEFAVQEYGERSLPELEAEDRVAVAAEKHQQTPRHPKVAEVYNRIRHEYEQFTSREHGVVSFGGLHVMGQSATNRG